MSTFRIALAEYPVPGEPGGIAIRLAGQSIEQAGLEHAGIICFPECFVPGYRGPTTRRCRLPTPAVLERAWRTVASAAARAHVLPVVLGTERAGRC